MCVIIYSNYKSKNCTNQSHVNLWNFVRNIEYPEEGCQIAWAHIWVGQSW